MRITSSPASKRSKNRLFKRTKGFRGGRRNLLRTAKETVMRADAYAYRDRRVRKREFRKLWIIRINAACRQRGISYSRFVAGLNAAGIEADRKMLAEVALTDAAAFDQLVQSATEALAQPATA